MKKEKLKEKQKLDISGITVKKITTKGITAMNQFAQKQTNSQFSILSKKDIN